MITGINESKTRTKHISCNCKCNFDDKKCSLNKKWNKNKCFCDYKSPIKNWVCKKDYIWNPSASACENDKYLGSIINDSVVICDKTMPTNNTTINFGDKKAKYKIDKLYILLVFS